MPWTGPAASLRPGTGRGVRQDDGSRSSWAATTARTSSVTESTDPPTAVTAMLNTPRAHQANAAGEVTPAAGAPSASCSSRQPGGRTGGSSRSRPP